MIAGIKGFEWKVRRCKEEKRGLRRIAKQSQGARAKKQLLGKTTWFKEVGKNRNRNKYKGGARKDYKEDEEVREQAWEPRTVIFVEYSKGGELANRLRE